MKLSTSPSGQRRSICDARLSDGPHVHRLEIVVSARQEPNSSAKKLSDRPIVAAIAAGDGRWFRAVADYTYDWESWHGPDGRLIWVNPAVERITGYTVAECLAMSDYPLPMVSADDRAGVVSALASARNQTSGESLDFRILNRNREFRWMALAWQPMYDSEGTYLGYRTSARCDRTPRAPRTTAPARRAPGTACPRTNGAIAAARTASEANGKTRRPGAACRRSRARDQQSFGRDAKRLRADQVIAPTRTRALRTAGPCR